MRKSFLAIAMVAVLSSATLSLAQPPRAVPAPAPAEHAHPAHGPHGGDLIELGKEEFHLELVHDEKAGVLALYVLDSSAKKAVPVPAKEIIINVKVAGKGTAYKLVPAPQPTDPKDNFTLYISRDKALMDVLEKHGIDATAYITIGAKPYSGKVEHHHHHEHAPAKK